MAYAEQQFLYSEAHEVRFAGWSTTTYRLQQCGWQLAAEHMWDRLRVRLAMRHPATGLHMVSEVVDVDFIGRRHSHGERLVFDVRNVVGRDIIINDSSFSDFAPIDAMPQFIEKKARSIQDFAIFAPLLVRTQQLIVQPDSVEECLARIRELQAPALAEIRERDRSEEQLAVPRQIFHAQILSLAA